MTIDLNRPCPVCGKMQHTPHQCPSCSKPMQLQGEGMDHFQVCKTCGKGYNVNYNPPQMYWEARKKKSKSNGGHTQ